MDESTARSHHPDSMRQVFLWVLLPILLLVLRVPGATYAQVVTNITPTTTAPLDLGTNVDTVGSTTQITGGTRPGSGTNLFHSFDAFTLGTGDTAHFLNDMQLPTNNIFGRVIGGEVSTIDGTLRTNNPLNAADPMNFGAANLWLVNPSGLFLGANARIEVGGSVSLSTANYLRFETATAFDLLSSPATLGPLSVAPVVAFGFLGSNPAPIVVQSSMLQVPEGQALSLVGGDITEQAASLRAPGGQLNLVSVASPGEVLVPSFQPEFFTTMGTVTIKEGATLDVSGQVDEFGTPLGNGNSGTVLVRGGQLVMDASTILANTVGAVDGASTAVDIQVSQAVALTNGTAIFTQTFGPGRGGDVQLTAGNLTMENFSSIFTGTFGGGGVGGNVTIQGLQGSGSAADAVVLTNGSTITTFTSGPGNGGDVQLTAVTMAMENASTIFTGTDDGVGGDVVLNVRALGLMAGSSIQSQNQSFTSGFGQGGNVTIQGLQGAGSMADSVVISGFGSDIVSQTVGTARSGDIAVLAETVSLTDRSTIRTETSGPGRGGDMHLTADNLTLENASRISTDTFFGDAVGGDLFLNVGTVRLLTGPLGGSQIQSTNFNSGTDLDGDGLVDVVGVGGNVTVQGSQGAGSTADSVVLSGGSQIVSTTSGSGRGGTITIQAGEVLLDGPGTGISFDTPQPFADMTLTINILHPNAGDLVVELESPTGKQVTLLRDVGGDGNNFSNTQFNDHASTQISSGSAPFTGPFKPLEPLGQFIDQPSAGNWTLTLQDNADGNEGSLVSWTLRIAGQTFPSTGGSVAIPDNGTAVQSTIAVTTPVGSTVPGPGDPAGISGDVTINAGTVTVQNGATLSATTRGTGKGGTIIINATGPVALTGPDSGLFTNSEASGAGGNIRVQASRMTLDSGATVSASSIGTGNAGTITINAGSEFLSTNSAVTTEATQASGGNITLLASDMIRLRDSQISASVSGETQTVGGNVIIDPQFVILQNSQIIAQANAGSGGTINVTAGVFIADPASIVDASATSGNSGTVSIQSPVQNVGGQLTPLPQEFSSAAALLLASRCAADPTGQFSSFVQTGREGVPQIPGALSPSPLSFLEPLTSGSLGSPSPNWAAARLGLDSLRVDDATQFRFPSACRS